MSILYEGMMYPTETMHGAFFKKATQCRRHISAAHPWLVNRMPVLKILLIMTESFFLFFFFFSFGFSYKFLFCFHAFIYISKRVRDNGFDLQYVSRMFKCVFLFAIFFFSIFLCIKNKMVRKKVS